MTVEHPLGRLQHHDPLNWEHRALVQPPPRNGSPYRSWFTRDVFDQKSTPQCAAEAAVGLCRTGPFRRAFDTFSDYDTYEERNGLYLAAQEVDPWPGNDYGGTSTDSPFKVLRSRNVIASWKWLFGEEELHEWVSWYGPAVVGTEWTNDMFSPDRAGFIRPNGTVAGGHAYRIVQVNPALDAYRIVNSWGRGWGQGGRAWMKRTDMAALLARGGEAVTAA